MVANGRFAMRPGLTLRGDYDAACLRGLARRTKSAAQGRRLLALAEIYDAGSRTKAACVGGVGLQTIRDWVLRFNAHGPEGLAGHRAAGPPGKLDTAQREALAAMVESGPIPAIHGTGGCGESRGHGEAAWSSTHRRAQLDAGGLPAAAAKKAATCSILVANISRSAVSQPHT